MRPSLSRRALNRFGRMRSAHRSDRYDDAGLGVGNPLRLFCVQITFWEPMVHRLVMKGSFGRG